MILCDTSLHFCALTFNLSKMKVVFPGELLFSDVSSKLCTSLLFYYRRAVMQSSARSLAEVTSANARRSRNARQIFFELEVIHLAAALNLDFGS